MNSFWATRRALLMLKSLERLLISIQELKVKNLLRFITGRRENQDVKLCHSPDSPKSSSITSSHNTSLSSTSSFSTIIQLRMMALILSNVPQILNWSNSSQEEQRQRKRTASRRVVKKKVIISAANNIIPTPDVSLELGKSISLTKAKEEEAARQVYATHVRTVTESVLEPARRRTLSIAFRDTSQMSKKVSFDPSQRLKGSSERTGRIPGVPNESIVVSATSSEGNGTKPEVPNKEKVTSEANDNEKKDDANDDKSIDLEMTDDEETDDEFIHRNEKVNDNEDEEMKNAKVEYFGKGDAEISDVAKAYVEKIEEIKGDAKKAELSPTSSILSLSSVPTPIPETPLLAPLTTLLPPPSVSTIPPVPHQTTTRIPTLLIITDAPTITTAVPESNALTDRHTADLIQKYLVKLALESSKIQKPTIDLEQEFEKSAGIKYLLKDKNEAKTKHGIGKSVKSRS
ncbi:hypothetical protein Tco_0348675 [Tanacetum coccineum]